ncbi:MAG: D-alanine--D-alanine ligase A [Acidobacteria bacterium]|nr:MAG: D-alanine--D-alanine ligase A [Acidobacteriota bacterium]
MKKIRVGVIRGGRSGEHEVSLRSAESILNAMDREKYDVVPITISHEGRWEPFTISADPSTTHAVDVVFPIVHGTYGEDGTIQGLFELANLPYVGAGVLGSAIGMDKDVMKRLLRAASLPIVEYWSVRKSELDSFLQSQLNSLPYPLFVKPANLGSSVGITKTHAPEELPGALQTAAEYDQKIVVERGVDAREIEVSVLGNDDPIASVPGEIIPSREFYDYDAKYVDDNSRLLVPAPLSDAAVQEAQQLAVAAFKALECSGMARVDLFLERPNGKFYVNEINTLPGFTSISMYPKLWDASGIPYPQLIDRLITLAIERHSEKSKLRTRY